MTRRIAAVTILVLAAGALFSQGGLRGDVGLPVATRIGADSAQQLLKEVSVSKFEDGTFWFVQVPQDEGFGTLKRFIGSPEAKEPIPDEEALGLTEQDKYVLGARVDFYKRGNGYVAMYPVRPIPIEGITKTISLWVIGRNYNHVLKILLTDFFGEKHELTMGKLNFMGWKKLTVAVPPTITQRDYHFTKRMGISFVGLRVDFDLKDTFGSYYVYFDDLRAVTDLFTEVSRDSDDMNDDW